MPATVTLIANTQEELEPTGTVHTLNRWLKRRIPITQKFMEFIRRASKEFSTEPRTFHYPPENVTIVGSLDEMGFPVVITVYKGAGKTKPKNNNHRATGRKERKR